MPAGRPLIALRDRLRYLGTRRGGSQPSHTPPAHARCVHQHAHACARMINIDAAIIKCLSQYPYQSSMHIDTHRQTWGMHMKQTTPSHTCSHTLPPLLPWPHTPSHPRSLTHQSDVSRSKMPAGSTLIALPSRKRPLGTRRGGSQPSHTPPAHARCVHQHAHACAHAHAPCTCTCAPCLSLALHMRAPCTRVCICIYICICICMCVSHVCVHVQDTGMHIHAHINNSRTSTRTDMETAYR
jgi:hypothetical protein